MLHDITSFDRVGMIGGIDIAVTIADEIAAPPLGVTCPFLGNVVAGIRAEKEFLRGRSRIRLSAGFTYSEYWHG